MMMMMRSGLLAGISWSVCILKSHRSLWESFSRTGAGLCIYHLFVWSNWHFLHISQWITLPTQSCLALYSFCANLLHSPMWLLLLLLCHLSKLNGSRLKLADKFTYPESSVSSTENDINTQLANRLSVIWKSDLTDEIKRIFSRLAVVSILLYGCTTWTLTKCMEKKLVGNHTTMMLSVLNKSCVHHHPQNSRCKATYQLSRKLS